MEYHKYYTNYNNGVYFLYYDGISRNYQITSVFII